MMVLEQMSRVQGRRPCRGQLHWVGVSIVGTKVSEKKFILKEWWRG